MSDTEKVYFQFPLSALAYGKADYPERLRGAILHFCIMERADAFREKHNEEQLAAMIEDVSSSDFPSGYNPNSQQHVSIIAARKMLNISNGNIQATIRQAQELKVFLNSMATKYGPSPSVRVRRDLFWDCINGKLKYRDFSVMCAVYAVLGDKAYFPITRSRIIAGAMGYKKPCFMTPGTLKAREDKAKPMTTKQIRLALDELVRRGLVYRVQANRRQVYYSNRMDRETLEQRIIEAKVKRAVKIKKERKADQSIQSKIEAAIKAELAGSGES